VYLQGGHVRILYKIGEKIGERFANRARDFGQIVAGPQKLR
jgi:hypothetical protein